MDETNELYYENSELFFKKNYVETYIHDTLQISYVLDVNACSEFVGNIDISNDTIRLMIQDISEVQCASASIERFTFVITNPENKKYIILR